MHLVALLGLFPLAAHAQCPPEEPILAEVACDSMLVGDLNDGVVELDWIYDCGWPDHGLYEDGPEDLYSFTCPSVGDVTIEVHDAICNMDLFVLSDECTPRGLACMAGDTGLALDPLMTTFFCAYAGQTVYFLVEGKGLVDPAGLCTAANAGEYVLQFDTVFGVCDITPMALTGPPVPGIAGVENTFYIEGATPDETVYVVVGTGLGVGVELPGCPGVNLDITGMHRLGPDRVNPRGMGERTTFIPAIAAGVTTWVQLVELTTCATSIPYEYTWL